MANFKLNDYKKNHVKTFAPYIIDYSPEGKDGEKTVALKSITGLGNAAIAKFISKFYAVEGIIANSRNTDVLKRSLVTLGSEFDFDEEGVTDEQAVAEVFTVATNAMRDSLRDLAEDKRKFDAFAREMGDNLIGWMEVYASYCLEYNLLGAGNKDPENGELKK